MTTKICIVAYCRRLLGIIYSCYAVYFPSHTNKKVTYHLWLILSSVDMVINAFSISSVSRMCYWPQLYIYVVIFNQLITNHMILIVYDKKS